MNFPEVKAEFQRLKTQYDAGTLNEADFKARLQALMIEDEQGRWWVIGYETGQWYVHDGEQWVPGEPPERGQAAPAVVAEPSRLMPLETSPTSKATRRANAQAKSGCGKITLRLAVTVGAMVVVAGIGIWGLLGRWGVATQRPTPSPRPSTPSAIITRVTDTPIAIIPQDTATPSAISSVSAPSCDYGGELKAIEALDDYTVRFTLCYPDVAFPAKVALPPFGIHPAEYLAATGGTGQFVDAPIGTGPYRLEAWHKDSELRLEANPDYWGEPAKIPKLQFHWNDDADARLGFLKTGDVDSIDNPPPQAYAEIQSNTDLRLYPRAGLDIGYLGISSLVKPFDDVRVRRAVAQAIDREWLVKEVYPAGTIIATHFTPCGLPNGCVGEPWYNFDPDRARMLLAEAGYPAGFETELFYRDSPRSYLLNPTGTARYIADVLEKHLNIRVKLMPTELDPAAFREAAWDGALPLYLSGWYVDHPDPINFLSPHWGEFGTGRFKSSFPEIWAILREATLTVSPDKRAELYTQANNLIKRDVPLVPLVHSGSAAAFRANVIDAHSSPLNLERFAAMSLGEGSTLVWKQATAPQGLYCADETESDTWRACAQITESLLGFKAGTAEVIPALAESYESNEAATEWVFHLRPGVKFHDDSTLDAGDVVTSWVVQWDAANPFHKGRTGAFDYFLWLFDTFLNTEK